MSDTREFQVTKTGKFYGFYSTIGRHIGLPGYRVKSILDRESETPSTDALEKECVDIEEVGLSYEDDTFDEVFSQERRREIMKAVCSLSEREAQIVSMYYGLCLYERHTLEEIGEVFFLTRSRVSILREVAVRKMWRSEKSRVSLLKLIDGNPYDNPKKEKKPGPYDKEPAKTSAIDIHKPNPNPVKTVSRTESPKRFMLRSHLKDGTVAQYPQPNPKLKYDVHSTIDGKWYYIFSYNDIRDNGARSSLLLINTMYEMRMIVDSYSGEVIEFAGGIRLSESERRNLYEKACR